MHPTIRNGCPWTSDVFRMSAASADYTPFTTGEIIERHDLAADLWIIRVRTSQRLDFEPGQYATLAVRDDGKMIERPYSIVSSPFESDLEFFIELVPAGRLTPRLYELRAGDQLYVRRKARGRMGLHRGSDRQQHLMVATVTGVAPFVSMVRTLRLQDDGKALPELSNVYLLQGASRSWEFGYDQELEELARNADWFRYIPTISRPLEDPGWKGLLGRVHEHVALSMERFGCNCDNTVAYLAGHPGMVEQAKTTLVGMGLPKEFVHEEKYWVEPRAADAQG